MIQESLKLKIIFYTDTLEYGGAEKYLEELIDYFSQANNRLYLLCADPQVFKHLKISERLEIISFKSVKFFDPRGIFIKSVTKNFLKKIEPDLVYFNFCTPYSCWFGVWAASEVLPKERLFGMMHNPEFPEPRYPLVGLIRRFIARIILHKIGNLICPSRAGSQLLAKNCRLESNKIRIIYNGVDHTPVYDSDMQEIVVRYNLAGKRIVVCVSRLVKRKGLETLIFAFKRVTEVIFNAVLLLVGDGYLLSKLKALALREGIAHNVIFAGFHPKVHNFFGLSEVAVVPSLYESFSYSVTEAMIQAKPVVATQVGGIPELINESCGILVPPADVSALSAAIIKILQDRSHAIELGQKAQERAKEEFSKERMFKKLKALFGEIVLSKK